MCCLHKNIRIWSYMYTVYTYVNTSRMIVFVRMYVYTYILYAPLYTWLDWLCLYLCRILSWIDATVLPTRTSRRDFWQPNFPLHTGLKVSLSNAWADMKTKQEARLSPHQDFFSILESVMNKVSTHLWDNLCTAMRNPGTCSPQQNSVSRLVLQTNQPPPTQPWRLHLQPAAGHGLKWVIWDFKYHPGQEIHLNLVQNE